MLHETQVCKTVAKYRLPALPLSANLPPPEDKGHMVPALRPRMEERIEQLMSDKQTMEVHGYKEEFYDSRGNGFTNFLGFRDVADPSDRPLGVAGRQQLILDTDVALVRNVKPVTVPAGTEVVTMVYPINGRMNKWRHPQEKA